MYSQFQYKQVFNWTVFPKIILMVAHNFLSSFRFSYTFHWKCNFFFFRLILVILFFNLQYVSQSCCISLFHKATQLCIWYVDGDMFIKLHSLASHTFALILLTVIVRKVSCAIFTNRLKYFHCILSSLADLVLSFCFFNSISYSVNSKSK